jgi:nitroimidazol reductase NimA-like FMN-containing flavoprotein (pyridoxamine 5'-phosphate oxidase superfamily)/GNAT superfamily N-acetyltransferase
MRKEIYRMDRDLGLKLLRRSAFIHIASVSSKGAPVSKTVHGVVVGNFIAFHGAPAGEKMDMVGQPAVVSAEEIIAQIPSYFVDPQRACPATTYYESVQIHGVIERVQEADAKAKALTALMDRFQPEGGHAPIDPYNELYRKAVAGIMVCQVSLEKMEAKGKLGQNRTDQELQAILEKLWARGAPGDARAIDRVVEANPHVPLPAFLAPPAGGRLCCALQSEDAPAAARLLQSAFWNRGIPLERLSQAQVNSQAWVGARDARGAIIATARALSDGVKFANIYDVVVAPEWQGRGIGKALVRLLLDHPAVRSANTVWLGTRDAQGLYARFGFIDLVKAPPRPYPSTEMVLLRNRF